MHSSYNHTQRGAATVRAEPVQLLRLLQPGMHSSTKWFLSYKWRVIRPVIWEHARWKPNHLLTMMNNIFLAAETVSSNESRLSDAVVEIRVQRAVMFLIGVSSLLADCQLQEGLNELKVPLLWDEYYRRTSWDEWIAPPVSGCYKVHLNSMSRSAEFAEPLLLNMAA